MAEASTLSLSGTLIDEMRATPHQADREMAALHLLDWVGCSVAGAATSVGHAFAQVAGTRAHPLSLAGLGIAERAWALGCFGSLLEMDDVHRAALLHPGPVVMPAVLACCTPENATLAPEAALRGYEAMIRLGRAVGPRHYAYFHNTATCGGLGASVAAAFMLGLDDQRTQWAIAHAMSVAGGLWQCRNEPGATKHLHVAEAARRGVQATLVAKAGVVGPLHVFEGPQGFFPALASDGRPDALLEGNLWAMHETSFKPWPACRHAHPAIDAALVLRDKLAGRQPDSIRIETYADAVLFCDCATPTDPARARFSLQHAVAVALTDGPPQIAAFEQPALDLPRYAALRDRTSVAVDATFTARYPAHFGARVRVQTGDDTFEIRIDDAWGDSENPMDAAAVIRKFEGLCSWAGIDAPSTRAIQNAALDPEGAAQLLPLLAALSPNDPKNERTF